MTPRMQTSLERRLALYPVHAKYRISTPNGITVNGFPFAMGDLLPADSSLRQMPLRLAAMIDQRQLEREDEEPAAAGGPNAQS